MKIQVFLFFFSFFAFGLGHLVTSGGLGNLGGKVLLLLLDTLTNFNALEALHLGTGLLNELADSLVVGLYIRLGNETDLLKVLAKAALDHLLNDFRGLARLGNLGGKDLLLLGNVLGGDVVLGGVLGVHGGDVHGNVDGELLVSTLKLDGDADLVHVDVGSDGGVGTAHGGETTDLDVLADLGNEGLGLVLDRLTTDVGLEEGINVVTVNGEGGLGDGVGEAEEVLVLGNEVGLAVDLDHDGLAALVGDNDLALGGDAAGLLVGLDETGLAKEVVGGLDVTVGLNEGLLAVHHTGAGGITELLDLSGGDGIEAGGGAGEGGRGGKGRNGGDGSEKGKGRELHLWNIMCNVWNDTERMNQKVMWNVEAELSKEMDGGQLIRGAVRHWTKGLTHHLHLFLLRHRDVLAGMAQNHSFLQRWPHDEV